MELSKTVKYEELMTTHSGSNSDMMFYVFKTYPRPLVLVTLLAILDL